MGYKMLGLLQYEVEHAHRPVPLLGLVTIMGDSTLTTQIAGIGTPFLESRFLFGTVFDDFSF